jgi:acetyl-CoA acetyltransferase
MTTTLKNAYIIDAIRTPFGRYAGGLALYVQMTLVLFRFKP